MDVWGGGVSNDTRRFRVDEDEEDGDVDVLSTRIPAPANRTTRMHALLPFILSNAYSRGESGRNSSPGLGEAKEGLASAAR